MAQIYAHSRKGKVLVMLLLNFLIVLGSLTKVQAQTAPVMDSFSPLAGGPVGTTVTIKGTGLSAATHVNLGNAWIGA
ncbi:IPT/TIG domain-containing protein, partial [Pontibacter cellulosilyticus]|uniref:IPT/TIG domain-containing protein n=1 Tax=Pontibacter cellulosilyticus TaxID=1720253 RepID=UPI001C9B3D65